MEADAHSVKGIILDLDGVLWRGEKPVPGAREAVTTLRERGFALRYVSNNSLWGVEGMHRHLIRLGFPVERDEVFLATKVLAKEIAARERRATVYLIGSEGFSKDLEEQGLRVIDTPEEIDYLVDYVVVGGDWELSFDKLTRALRCLVKGARFAVPNADATYPAADGLLPGSGAIVAAVSAMIRREPDLMVGKPRPDILHMAIESMGLPPETCLMVGDSLDTDVAAAARAGIRSVLVLTGNSTQEDVERTEEKPWRVLDSVADLPRIFT